MNSTASPLLPRSEGIVIGGVCIAESLAIMIGNLLTIIAFTTTPQLRKRKFYLLVNLAVSDFLVGAVAVPWWVYDLAKKFDLWHHESNVSTAIARETLSLYIISASLIGLMLVSVERMYATWRPFKHRVAGETTYHMCIGLNWSLSLLMPSFNIIRRYKLIPFNTFRYIYTSVSSCMLLIICASYLSIWIKFKFQQHPQHHMTTAQDRKLTVSLFIATAVSLVTMLPYRVILAEKFAFPSLSAFRRTYYSVILLLYVNSLVNPIIYSLRMAPFRQAVVRLVLRRSAERTAKELSAEPMKPNNSLTSETHL